MAFQIEHIYDSDGSDLSNPLHTTTLEGANHMEYDGKYLWVTCGQNGVAIFEWWGELSDNEPTFEELDELIYSWYGATKYDEEVILGVGQTKYLQFPRVSAVTAMDGDREATEGGDFSIARETGAVTRLGDTPITLKFTYNYNRDVHRKLRLVTFISFTATQALRTTCLPALADVGNTATSLSSGEVAYTKVSAQTAGVFNGFFIKKCGDYMYVTNGATFSSLFQFNIASQQFVKAIPTVEVYNGMANEFFAKGQSYGMNSNLESVNGRLWFAGSVFSDTWPQRIYHIDPLQPQNFIYTEITAKPSRARVWLAYGYNGYVYCTNPGNVSVSKFNASSGALTSTIRVNAEPSHMFSGPDKRIFVSSYAGMLSLIDWDDDGVHNDWAATSGDSPTDRAVALQIDPTDGSKVWFVDNSNVLARHDLNTREQIESVDPKSEEMEDWQFFHPKLKNPETMWISPASSFTDSQGVTHALRPYIFVIQGDRLLAWRLENQFYRPVFASITGIAAVTNQLEYFGG